MRTNASISWRHIGHDRSEGAHPLHVARCPQGIQARRFSSRKHSAQGFAIDDSDVCVCSAAIVPVFIVADFFSSISTDGDTFASSPLLDGCSIVVDDNEVDASYSNKKLH
jgi:hypothetical protein